MSWTRARIDASVVAGAARRTVEHKVRSQAEALAGIVTDRDLALRGYMQHLGPTAPVASVISKTVVAVDVDADTTEAMSKMIAHGVRRLAVTDSSHKLVGVVSLDDLTIFVEQEADMVRRVLAAQLKPEAGGWAGTWDGG